MSTSTITASITNRNDLCRCGCKGTDPWHKREYKRTIRNVVPSVTVSREDAIRRADGRHVERIIETGIARIPGRSKAVVVRSEWWIASLAKWVDVGWTVNHAETEFDA